jgi:hypothetical protein
MVDEVEAVPVMTEQFVTQRLAQSVTVSVRACAILMVI